MQKKVTNQRFSLVPLAKIEPSDYQRSTKAAQVENIVKNFDEAKLGTLTLSKRDGKYYIIDGAHRLSALRRLQYTHAVCEVLTGLTHEQEAEYFRTQGVDKRALRPLDLFKAGLIAENWKCVMIDQIVKDNSFQIGFAYKDFNQIGAIQALFTIFDDYGFGVLDETLFTIANAWAGIPKAVCSDSLLGVAEFVSTYNVDDFASRLFKCFPAIWREYREAVRNSQNSIKARRHFCRILVEHYNKGLHARSKKRLKLPT
ncbi:MAG: ParB N-terminal domain-containing protein [Defluviitaleaceae bacterium]|nr:ParB N-terminal domain-containing protein [Defluviitaleaceae bacterium]